jgi:hypothetical protein
MSSREREGGLSVIDWNVRATRHNWLAMLLLLPALLLAGLFGFVIFFVVLGAALFAFLVIALRMWWLNRGRRRQPTKGALEGEFVVIRDKNDEDVAHRR